MTTHDDEYDDNYMYDSRANIALNFRKEGKKPVLPYFLVIQVVLKIIDDIRNYNYKTKYHTRLKLWATNLRKKQIK
jgi:hypothetical protein